MAKYTLKVPVDQDDTAVFAIHSEWPDYQLIFFLNRELRLQLKRQKEDLNSDRGTFFGGLPSIITNILVATR